MYKINIAEIVRLRKHLNVNQVEAGKALGMSRTTYLQREGSGQFTEEELSKLAGLLKVNVSDLYETEGDIGINGILDRLAESSYRTEAMLSAALVGLAKVLEKLTDRDAAKILEDLIAASNLQSSNLKDGLKRLKQL